MNRATQNIIRRRNITDFYHHRWETLVTILVTLFIISPSNAQTTPGFALKEAQKEISGHSHSGSRILALDQKNWKRPQSSFNWVAMARDIKVPWDSHGRSGWLTDDAYVEPVDPGVSEFSPDTEIFYIVFEVGALDAPSQFRAAWYYMPDGKTYDPDHSGTDALFLEMNEKAGYLEIYRPDDGWKKGQYLLKIFFESPGQEPFEGNVVGTMLFTITDKPIS